MLGLIGKDDGLGLDHVQGVDEGGAADVGVDLAGDHAELAQPKPGAENDIEIGPCNLRVKYYFL